ncbi:hypothetical protein JCM3765_004079 [Sporobolomyces pararoseus]
MSHPQIGSYSHGLVATNWIRLRKTSNLVQLNNGANGSDHTTLVSQTKSATQGRAAEVMKEMAFWNDTSAKNFNLIVGFALLLFFLAAVPLWIDFFSAVRGKSSGWRLSNSPSSSILIPVDEKDGKLDEKKSGGVTVEIGGVRQRRIPSISPTGLFTARVRTFRSTWLLRSLPLPFSILSHLSIAQVLLCLISQGMVIFSLFEHCPDHHTNWKRTGYVAVAQLPAVFLAATKNGIGFLIGTSYEKINFFHRVAGRLTILASLIHSLLFLRKAEWNFNWESSAQKTGMIGMFALTLMFFSAIKVVRSTFYQSFLVCHICGIIIFLVAIQLHAPAVARPYTISCLVIYIFDLVVRVFKTRSSLVSLAALSAGTTMVQAHSVNNGWRAGQYVVLRVWSWRRWCESHPFTVAVASSSESPLESGSHKLTLLAKSNGGFTRSLFDRSNSSSVPLYCSIEGPYGHPLSLDFASFQSVLLFAGGTGITFCASILEELVGKAARGESSNQEITLVWSMREIGCIEWYQSLLTSLMHVVEVETSLSVSIYLHVTSTPNLPSISPIPNSSVSPCRPNSTAYLSQSISKVLHSLSQPKLSGQSRALSTLPNGGGLGVGVCGPGGLGKEVRETISRVEKDRALKVGGIVLHEETFGC